MWRSVDRDPLSFEQLSQGEPEILDGEAKRARQVVDGPDQGHTVSHKIQDGVLGSLTRARAGFKRYCHVEPPIPSLHWPQIQVVTI